MEDFVAWNRTKSFASSIRCESEKGRGQGSDEVNHIWEILWKSDVPNKVKIFIWMALQGKIHGFAMLVAKHIPLSPQCPVCKAGAEHQVLTIHV